MWTSTKPPRRRQHLASLVLVNLLWSPALAGATPEQTEADRLNRVLFDADSDVREEAVRALTEASASLALPALQQALSDSDAGVRLAAIDALGDIGGDIVIGLLAVALVDPVPEVREDAVYALGRLGVPLAQQAVAMALADPEASVRDAARQIARELTHRRPTRLTRARLRP